MRLIYTSEANLEITEAGAYYRRISKELADVFKQRLVSALAWIIHELRCENDRKPVDARRA